MVQLKTIFKRGAIYLPVTIQFLREDAGMSSQNKFVGSELLVVTSDGDVSEVIGVIVANKRLA